MQYTIFSVLMLFLSLLSFSQNVSNEDCRLKEKYLHPLIQTFNPFFTEHKWLAIMQQELARLDENRYLVISHHGCKRHFIAFNLYIKASEVVEIDSFWVREASNLLRAVYYGTAEYGNFGQDFEDRFTERLSEVGLNKEFNFPIGNKNFLCEIIYPTLNHDAKIRVESVELLFEEEIAEKKRVPSVNDDALYVKKPLTPVPPVVKLPTKKKGKGKNEN